MQIKSYLVAVLVMVVCLFYSTKSFSQNKRLEMDDSTGLHSYTALRGDTVLIDFDSAYVMNKKTFKLFQDTYKRVQKGDPSVKKLLDEYESLISLQDSMLKAKEAYYQQLKSDFDSLVQTSNIFLSRTDGNISAINQSLSNATNELNNIKSLLNDSLDKLKKQSNQKLKAAIEGFAVGVGVASLVFLITK